MNLENLLNRVDFPSYRSVCIDEWILIKMVYLLGIPAHVFIHEMGHYLLIQMLYADAHPRIKLNAYGFAGGETNINPDCRLSKLGKLIGKSATDVLSYSSGAVSAMISLIALQYICRSDFVRTICQYHALGIIYDSFLFELFIPESDAQKIWETGGPLSFLAWSATCIFLARLI